VFDELYPGDGSRFGALPMMKDFGLCSRRLDRKAF
jgi:hypothetical protein